MKRELFVGTISLFFFLVCGFLCFADVFGSESQPGNLDSNSYYVKTSKTAYLESERIWIENYIYVGRDNKLDRKPILWPNTDVRYTLLNSKKDSIKYIGGIADFFFGTREYPDSMFFSFDLLDGYGVKEDFQDSQMLGWYYLPADTYTFSAEIVLEINNEKHILKANSIQFTVDKPAGAEQLARAEFLKIGKAAIEMQKPEYIESIISGFLAVYPNSSYRDHVTYELFIGSPPPIAQWSNDSTRKFIENWLLENPNNNFNQYYLEDLWFAYNRDTELYMNAISALKYVTKGSLLEKYIDKKILWLNRKNKN